MPVVDVFGAASWLPNEGEIHEALRRSEAPGSTSSGFPPRFDLTRRFLLDLPKMVARAVSQVDNIKVTPGEVKIRVHRQHPWDYNHDDWAIDVQPGDRDATELIIEDMDGQGEGRKLRREAIANNLGHRIEKWLTQPFVNQEVRPSYEVDVRPIDGSGLAFDHGGEAYLAW